MPKRINSKIDIDILQDLAMGMKQKEIAQKYNVSTSYISKVKTGQKDIEIYIPEKPIIVEQNIDEWIDKNIHYHQTVLNHFKELKNMRKGEN